MKTNPAPAAGMGALLFLAADTMLVTGFCGAWIFLAFGNPTETVFPASVRFLEILKSLLLAGSASFFFRRKPVVMVSAAAAFLSLVPAGGSLFLMSGNAGIHAAFLKILVLYQGLHVLAGVIWMLVTKDPGAGLRFFCAYALFLGVLLSVIFCLL